MATKFITVHLNQQSVKAMLEGNQRARNGTPSKRERADSVSSANQDGIVVEYSYQDTFTMLLEKCLVAHNIKGNDSSSTNQTNDDHGSSRSLYTKQALLYDKEHMLVTMLQEVVETEPYFIEIIDNQMMNLNHLASSALPPSLENQDSAGSERGSFSHPAPGHQQRQSSLASLARPASSFASAAYSGMDRQTFISCDTDFIDERSKSDLTALSEFAQRKTQFKVTLVGLNQAGKTSLAYRFVDNTSFLSDYEPTYVDTYEQEMNMIDPSDGLNRVVNLTIKDVGFTTLKDQMILDSDALIFCFDVTNEESFFSLSSLFQMKLQAEYSSNTDEEDEQMAAMQTLISQIPNQNDSSQAQKQLRPVVLVGCKSDLSSQRQVDYLDGERTAESFKAPYIECSAASNHRVEDVFELVLIQLFKQEKAERDRQIAEKSKQFGGGIAREGGRDGRNRNGDESCCTIF